MTNSVSWLESVFITPTIEGSDEVPKPRRSTLVFRNGLTVTDDAGDDQTIIDAGAGGLGSWQPFGPMFAVTPPPALGSWAALNMTAIGSQPAAPVASTVAGAINLVARGVGAGNALQGLELTAGGEEYTITAGILCTLPQAYATAGIFVRSSAAVTNKVRTFCVQNRTAPSLTYQDWTDKDTFNNDGSQGAQTVSPVLLRIRNYKHGGSPTDRRLQFSVSFDGVGFLSPAVAEVIVLGDIFDTFGFFVDAAGVSPQGDTSATLFSWSVTYP